MTRSNLIDWLCLIGTIVLAAYMAWWAVVGR